MRGVRFQTPGFGRAFQVGEGRAGFRDLRGRWQGVRHRSKDEAGQADDGATRLENAFGAQRPPLRGGAVIQ